MLTRIATNYFVEDTNPRNGLQHDHMSIWDPQKFISRHTIILYILINNSFNLSVNNYVYV